MDILRTIATNIRGKGTKRRGKQLSSTRCTTNQGGRIPLTTPYVLPLPTYCDICGAKLFRNESSLFCCGDGDIRLAPIVIPDILRALFIGDDVISQHFRKYVMLYNSTFAFTSLGVKKDHELAHRSRGIYTFRVQGQVYHFINDILPTSGRPRYIQLYFFDTDTELQQRLQISPDLQQIVVKTLMRVMDNNPYCQFFRFLRTLQIDDGSRIIIRADPLQDQRTHNEPTASQVAAVWVEDPGVDLPLRHDIVVYARSGTSHRIMHYYGCYDPLQYPILFPQGETGWHRNIYKHSSGRRRRRTSPSFPICNEIVQSVEDLLEAEDQAANTSDSLKKIPCREYYCYRLQIRRNDSSVLLRSGRLLQQFVVDMYVKLETTRLDFIRGNQETIRAELYQGIVDSYNAGERSVSNIGHRFVLPGSFIGCDRDMRCRYLNSMSLVQHYGKPDIFLTITCNPRWQEIERELLPFEEAQNRPDLVARVFRSKLVELKRDIINGKIFGTVAAYVYVVEFQKRGLPHAHFLIILDTDSKIRSPEQYDALCCAEIPDSIENSHLYRAVLKHMMHGPCGRSYPNNPCMKTGVCKNHYPRDFADMTTNGRNSYPIYRRRCNGVVATVRGAELDNRWVVPYNPYLLSKYDCHLNVEVCSTIKAVKYLYKYVYKGHNRVFFALANVDNNIIVDEITSYQSARWVSPPEATWRIFRFALNEIHPNVVPLQVHLPNMQTVTFRESEHLGNVALDERRKTTMLTGFFDANREDQYARRYFYHQFPEHYVWHVTKKEKYWAPRQRGFAIGRLVYANPSEGERFYLRLLLANVKGPRSFDDLLNVNGTRCTTFREAADMLGLLESDNSIESCLREASQYQMPFVLRRLFATLLIFCQPKNPKSLWDTFFPFLSEDFALSFPKNPRKVQQLTLKNICSTVESMGKRFESFDFGDLCIDEDISNSGKMKEIEEELNIPITVADINAVEMLNNEQRHDYDIVYRRVMSNGHGAFFLDGPGGTGKTFLYTALLANLRIKGNIALAVATSGIAAGNIAGGRTANSRFKIPLDLEENLGCQISKLKLTCRTNSCLSVNYLG